MRIVLLLFTLLMDRVGTLVAQITEVANLTGRYEALHTLHPHGPKFLERTSTGFTLYETDLSVYQSAVYPTLPVGYTYATSPAPWYITVGLFDLDPGSIEYLILLFRDGSPSSGTMIARMDGTVLLMDTMFGPNGYDVSALLSSGPMIMSTDNGPMMVLNQLNQGSVTASRIYQLPGELPCLDCTGGEMGLSGGLVRTGPGGFTLLPNPATELVWIEFDNHWGDTSTALNIYDSRGNLVKNIGAISGSKGQFSISGMTSGTYQVVATRSDGLLTSAKQLVISR